MQTETAVTTGRWIRLGLLLCTLVGLAAMHTLGHGAHASGAHPAGHPAGSTISHVVGSVASGHVVGSVDTAVEMTAGCPEDGCRHTVALPLGPLGGDLPWWSVCLAVLGAFAVVLLVAVLLRRGSVSRPTARGSLRTPGPRAPPPRPVGLRLATASVLRR